MSLQAPMVGSKTLGPSPELEFMGIVLYSIRMEACHPDDKLNRAREILNSFTQQRSVRLFELQSLIGTLQCACKAVVPGRNLLKRMINLTKGVPSRFHHIRLNKEFFKDLKMWKAWSYILTRRVQLATVGTLMGNGFRVDGYLTCNSAE